MVSIILPVFNGERYLKECVDSVVAQKEGEWELIVVDDGSTDNTPSIISQYDDPRIRYIRKHNSGVTETRWKGIEASRGEWVTFLDADDMLFPDCMENISNHLTNEADIISFDHCTFSKSDDLERVRLESKALSTSCKTYTTDISSCRDILLGKMLPCLWGNVYRRGIFLQNKQSFLNGLKVAEDTFFNLEICLKAMIRIKAIPATLYGYRENLSSVTRSVTPSHFDSIYQSILYLYKLIDCQSVATQTTLRNSVAFRLLLLWSTFMFHTDNSYYTRREMRKKMRLNYLYAFPHLYPYLKVYLLVDLFISSNLSKKLIARKSGNG